MEDYKREIIPPNAYKICPKNPNFSISTLKNAIPKHCFERSLLTSSYYLFRDIALVAVLFYCAYMLQFIPYGWLLYPVYWVAQGTAFLGLWVLAHECGHDAFSEFKLINNIVGGTIHSLLLIPYFSWKYSHAAHHIATNDYDRDTGFIPFKRSKFGDHQEARPVIWEVFYMVRMLVIGFQAYLIGHTGSTYFDKVENKSRPKWISHFNPSSPFFRKSNSVYVHLSTFILVNVIVLFGVYIHFFGWWSFCKYYFMSYLVETSWLMMYTFLHHSDIKLPHYSEEAWDFTRGALSTIDRPYGIFDWLHHKIGSTHVLHHFFSKIPHYHAYEATQAIKPILGDLYNTTTENPFVSLWKNYEYCKFKEEKGKIRWWKKFPTRPDLHGPKDLYGPNPIYQDEKEN